jgi:GDP-D-mannose 3', 5'-epimerase
MSTILITGAGGFIGSHLAERLKKEGNYVIGVDIKHPEYKNHKQITDEFHIIDLRYDSEVDRLRGRLRHTEVDYIYNLAADMGGMGYVTGKDAQIMQNSGRISLNMIDLAKQKGVEGYLITSSACRYPEHIQMEGSIKLSEEMAYPANPQDGYGWEKIFAELLCRFYRENFKMNTKIAVFHNIYGEMGTYDGGKEKAPAALCRKIAKAENGDQIDVWGDGTQLRSFCHVDDAVEGLIRLMGSDVEGAVNIGSDEEISIGDFTKMIIEISGKDLGINYIDGAIGVNSRNSDNKKAETELGFTPKVSLREGMERTYDWINKEINKKVMKAVLVEGANVEDENTSIHILETELNYATEREMKNKGFWVAERRDDRTIYMHHSKFKIGVDVINNNFNIFNK